MDDKIDKPFFMIIIPFFNAEKTIEKCLYSCIEQTFKDIIIVCVDDGATDNSTRIIETIKEKDKRIFIIHNWTNESLLVSRFKPIPQFQSRYVLYLDSDDEIAQDACQKLFDILSVKSYDVLEFGFKYIYLNYYYIPVDTGNATYLKFLLLRTKKYSSSVINKAYRYDIIDKAKNSMSFFYCNMGEDVYCSAIFASLAESRGVLNEVLYFYNDTNGMSTNRNKRGINELTSNIESALNSQNKIMEYMTQNNRIPDVVLKTFLWKYQSTIYNFVFSHSERDNFDDVFNLLKKYKNVIFPLLLFKKYRWKFTSLVKALLKK
jgi:glycosyltransferase involved in cell wall biosynthesis